MDGNEIMAKSFLSFCETKFLKHFKRKLHNRIKINRQLWRILNCTVKPKK